MSEKDEGQIMQDFGLRRRRQLIAIVVALFLVLFLAVLYKRPLLGEFSRNTVFGSQVIVIAAFIGFSGVNWRCPSCTKYLGNDINRRVCRKCGSRLR